MKRPQLEMRHFHQEDVMQKVADSAGPSLEGTKADAVLWPKGPFGDFYF